MTDEKQTAKMYFVAIVLPERLDSKIRGYKQWMKEHFGCKVGLKSPAHITLIAPFWVAQEKEPSLVQQVTNIAQSVSPFTISTVNFSSFGARTLFVAVAPNASLAALKKATDRLFNQAEFGIKTESRSFHPHITIATRDLHKKDFAEAWALFQQKTFAETFEAEGLSLLKHNGLTWDVYFTAPFDGDPSAANGAPL